MLAWLVPRGWSGKHDPEEIKTEVWLAQHPWEEISRRKQILGVGEETEGKGQEGERINFKNQASVTELFLKTAPIITLGEIA